MRLVIKSRGVELTDELRAHATTRVQFALGRFASELQRVEIVVADINGPRGGIDKECRILVRGARLDDVFVEERAVSTEAAVAIAANRVARAVQRALARQRLQGAPLRRGTRAPAPGRAESRS